MADPITWDDVLGIASELEEVPDVAQTMILDYVNNALNPAMFTTAAYKLARAYLAAHMGSNALPGTDGTALGAVLSETVGGISRTYESTASAVGGDGLTATTYGQMYSYILRTCKARLPRVIL